MATITTPDALTFFNVTTVDFENIASHDGEDFGFQVGQPYANIGLSLLSAVVSSRANLNSSSGGVGVQSAAIYDAGYRNSISCHFSVPQKAVGFFYRDVRATSFHVLAYSADSSLLEEGAFQVGAGYAGFIRKRADIDWIQIMAPHDTIADAIESRAFIDDLSFATTGRWRIPFIIRPLTWIWTILIGYILLTPIGPICIVCDSPIGSFWSRFLGVSMLVLGGIGLWGELTGRRARQAR